MVLLLLPRLNATFPFHSQWPGREDEEAGVAVFLYLRTVT